jgi:hypothetical protein
MLWSSKSVRCRDDLTDEDGLYGRLHIVVDAEPQVPMSRSADPVK